METLSKSMKQSALLEKKSLNCQHLCTSLKLFKKISGPIRFLQQGGTLYIS